MSRNPISACFFLILILAFGTARAEILEDNSSASIYAYFNVTDEDADSSLSLEHFNDQLEEINVGNYTVLSLTDLLDKEARNVALDANTISITFDEPDEDTYAKAIPLLVKAKIPFAIFISPGSVTQNQWDTLLSLKKNDFVTIGLSSYTYGHLGNWSEEKITEDLNQAKSQYRDHFGTEPLYFVYPLGEYSDAFVSAVRRQGFKAAFGQNSGVVTASLDKMKLPRFTMTDDYGDIERFRTTSNALPFPVKDVQPDVTYESGAFPAIGFTIDDRISLEDVKKTKCFSSGDIQPETLNPSGHRIEVRYAEQPVTDRLRINCTIPVAAEIDGDDPRYRWLGFLLYFPVQTDTQVEEETDPSPEQP